MSENLRAFLEAVQADSELREKLAKMGGQEIIAAAKERGFELTEADLKPSAGEMDDGELGNVAGGWGFCLGYGVGWGNDTDTDNRWWCNCPVVGAGDDADLPDIAGGTDNCECVILGVGTDN